jgi:hypothetical protein
MILICFNSNLIFQGGNYVVQFLDKFSTAPALMLVVMMEAIAASWVRKILLIV